MYKKSIPFSFKVTIVLTTVISAYSCKTINLNQSSQTNTTQQVQLGTIGSEKDFLLQKGFNSSALPSYGAQ